MRCEDYPCCGHTDGLPCDWTYTPEARTFDSLHAFCEHEHGHCEVGMASEVCDYCGESEEDCECDDEPWDGMEDQWLDGSYEE